ncbi:nitroreductase [Owenweeksia hongkongensis DSM 17368]|uniref:Nitroreductase n=1 Tax=Owenweeksia hongkongensis (strain DSM 17368 / CIP 108786 / JCM 12287 / NRRL B-23963 / UST20020801) TaxID=926562 RepID=G8R259_OWEHD|nr:nitroreductase family protein [Owenweeksia hongkongensis]AEV31809.1 nitroreductase [Owenweeksia hongkongensis DSM 17368]
MIEGKDAETKHRILPEITKRWSPRAFSEIKVEQEKLLRAFEAARWAPSSRNEQPWRFIVAQKGEEHYDKLFDCLDEGNKKWAYTAPVLAACLAKTNFDYKNKPNAHHAHDLGLAMGGLLAQATTDGLYVHQMAGIIPENILKNFNVDGEKFVPMTMFVMGYRDEHRLKELSENDQKSEHEPRKRKELSELISGSNFGEAPAWTVEEE